MGEEDFFAYVDTNTVTLSRKTMMGVSKGMRSSDSWRKAFIRRVRKIDVTVNWSFSMLVVREGC